MIIFLQQNISLFPIQFIDYLLRFIIKSLIKPIIRKLAVYFLTITQPPSMVVFLFLNPIVLSESGRKQSIAIHV